MNYIDVPAAANGDCRLLVVGAQSSFRAGEDLLAIVDVVSGAGERRIGHDVHGERGDVSRSDDPPDRAVSSPMPELPPITTTICPGISGLGWEADAPVMIPPGCCDGIHGNRGQPFAVASCLHDRRQPGAHAVERVTAAMDEFMATVLRHPRTGQGSPLEEELPERLAGVGMPLGPAGGWR